MGTSFGLFSAFVAMFGFGIGNALGKMPAEKFPYQKVIFIRDIFSSLTLAIGLLFFLNDTNFDYKFILLTFIFSILGYFSLVFFFKALKIGKVGLVTPIANSSTLITILLSVIFFNERLGVWQTVAVLMIMFGILASSVNLKDFKNSHLFNLSSGLPFAIMTCVLWGILFFFYKYPVNIIGPALTAFIIEFGSAILSGTNLKISKIKLSPINRKDIFIIFLVGFCSAIGSLFYNLGIKTADVSIVSAITFSCPLITIIYGRLFYREKLSAAQYTAVSMILVGIVILSYIK